MKIYQQDFDVDYKKNSSPLTKADIYPRLAPTMEWDTAAGQVIIEQSEGGVVNFNNKTPLNCNKESLFNPWFICST